MMCRPSLPWSFIGTPVLALLAALAMPAARADSACSSDGQPAPVALQERFINADCETCWTGVDAPLAGPGTLVVEWIVPGTQGDDAPLSGAARRDGLTRLHALHREAPAGDLLTPVRTTPRAGPTPTLRVAHGLTYNNYIAASIEMKPRATPQHPPWTAWLLLVETLPAGAEGSRIERHLVRNSLQARWDGRDKASPAEADRFFESRSMYVPEGAQPRRLRVLGWVEDTRGHIRSMAFSHCAAAEPTLVESGTGPKLLAPGFLLPADSRR
jgi:hypothetical protein